MMNFTPTEKQQSIYSESESHKEIFGYFGRKSDEHLQPLYKKDMKMYFPWVFEDNESFEDDDERA